MAGQGGPIDLPHHVRLAIQEREFGRGAFQKFNIGLDDALSQAMCPSRIRREQTR